MEATKSEKTKPTDSDLLQRFVRERDESAFGLLVGRYEGVVMGAALRQTGNIEMARDVAQGVFVTLARRSASLLDHARLGGWLYRTASFQASRLVRSEGRRRKRESTYALDENKPDGSDPELWEPLENALRKMPAKHRELIVMHYFQDSGYPEMAAELGLSEPAARKRVSRALAELGERLKRGGSAKTATQLLAGALGTQAALTPSPGLAAKALLAAGAASAPFFSNLLTLSSLKITAATIAALAIPLGLQWSSSRSAADELERHRLAISANDLGIDGQAPAASAERRRLLDAINAARSELRFIEAELATEQTRLEEAKQTIDQIGTEVVISHGNPDELAAGLVPLITKLAGALRLEEVDTPETSVELEVEAFTDVTDQLLKSVPLILEIPKLDADPAAKSRFISALIVGSSDLETSLREEIEAVLLPKFIAAKEAGLVFSERPIDNPRSLEGWSKRYDAAVRDQADSIKHLLPEKAANSPVWDFSLFGEGEGEEDEFSGLSELFEGLTEFASPEGTDQDQPAVPNK